MQQTQSARRVRCAREAGRTECLLVCVPFAPAASTQDTDVVRVLDERVDVLVRDRRGDIRKARDEHILERRLPPVSAPQTRASTRAHLFDCRPRLVRGLELHVAFRVRAHVREGTAEREGARAVGRGDECGERAQERVEASVGRVRREAWGERSEVEKRLHWAGDLREGQ